MDTQNSPFNMSRLLDVEMDVTVRFGLAEIPLQEVVGLGNGSMIELNRTVDSPVELLVNNSPFARGEVVVVDGYYSIKITELDLPENASDGLLTKNPAGGAVEQQKPVQNQIPASKPNPAAQLPSSPPPQPAAAKPVDQPATKPPLKSPNQPKPEENK